MNKSREGNGRNSSFETVSPESKAHLSSKLLKEIRFTNITLF